MTLKLEHTVRVEMTPQPPSHYGLTVEAAALVIRTIGRNAPEFVNALVDAGDIASLRAFHQAMGPESGVPPFDQDVLVDVSLAPIGWAISGSPAQRQFLQDEWQPRMEVAPWQRMVHLRGMIRKDGNLDRVKALIDLCMPAEGSIGDHFGEMVDSLIDRAQYIETAPEIWAPDIELARRIMQADFERSGGRAIFSRIVVDSPLDGHSHDGPPSVARRSVVSTIMESRTRLKAEWLGMVADVYGEGNPAFRRDVRRAFKESLEGARYLVDMKDGRLAPLMRGWLDAESASIALQTRLQNFRQPRSGSPSSSCDGMPERLATCRVDDGRHLEILRALSAAGVDLDATFTYQTGSLQSIVGTMLHAAVEKGEPETVLELLKLGCDPALKSTALDPTGHPMSGGSLDAFEIVERARAATTLDHEIKVLEDIGNILRSWRARRTTDAILSRLEVSEP